MTFFDRKQGGQALVMVTLALFSMLGMIGLVVDLGWGYYIKKAAQGAADAAALAAVQQVPLTGPFECGTTYTCQNTLLTCSSPSGTNLDAGCRYASLNGFEASGRQNVTLTSGTSSPPPTAPGVAAYYWVTARVSEGIPQLFSSILGNTFGTSSARATAAVVLMTSTASLYALNRQNDRDQSGNVLVDIDGQGGGAITAEGGVYMASNASGATGIYAGLTGGSFTVKAPFTDIRKTGWVDNPASFTDASGTPSLQNGFPDGANYKDPMRGKGQPPAPSIEPFGQYDHPLTLNMISGDCDNPTNLTPGYYYVTKNGTATGDSIHFSGCVNFTSGSGNFGDYVFFGGVDFSSPHAVLTFSPGRYIFAGTLPGKKLVQSVFAESNGVTLKDTTPLGMPQSSDNAGEIFVFTNAAYPGLKIPTPVQPITGQLQFGPVDIQTGNDSMSLLNLHGLNASSPYLPAELQNFTPVVFWQDQKNSIVKYDPEGYIDTTSCGSGHSLDNPCTNNTLAAYTNMSLQAAPNLHLYGTIYQPRGATMTFQGNGSAVLKMAVQLITGRVVMGGGPTIVFDKVPNPVSRKVVALVE